LGRKSPYMNITNTKLC